MARLAQDEREDTPGSSGSTSSCIVVAKPSTTPKPPATQSSPSTSGEQKKSMLLKPKQTTLTNWMQSLTRADAKPKPVPQTRPEEQHPPPNTSNITSDAASQPRPQPQFESQASTTMTSEKLPKSRSKKHSWFYATVKPANDEELPELDTRGTFTLEDEFTMARYKALHGETEIRPKRPRPSYAPPPKPTPKQRPSKASMRNVSGETLVPSMDDSNQQLLDDGIRALDMDWRVDGYDSRGTQAGYGDQARPRSRGLGFLGKATSALASTASILGKRSREVFGGGKEKSKEVAFDDETDIGDRPYKKARISAASLSNHRAVGSRRSSARTVDQFSPLKKARLSVASASSIGGAKEKEGPREAKQKKWCQAGLYNGQEQDFDARFTDTQNKLKRKSNHSKVDGQRRLLPLPMFVGKQLMETQRDFRLPFDVFSPLPPGQPKPDEWRKTGSNRFVGDSATEWKKTKHLPPSRCLCTPESGCDEDCQNRYMLYECDDSNCNIGKDHCTNRAFAELKERTKTGKKYHIGVEVMKTFEKGFGVRACRTFQPDQIIVEYAGEIITQEECERRMRNEYKDNECYYLMTFDQNMIIDATRGSIARFINHSCDPNCRMIKWTVGGKPRMALFAGDRGIMTGEELTYDYNFDPFSLKNVQDCHCNSINCRGKLGPRATKDKKEGPVATAKRKLNQFIGNGPDTSPASSPKKLKKNMTIIVKRRNTIGGGTASNRLSDAMTSRGNKRVASAATSTTALLDKENLRASSSRSSTASGSSSRGRDADAPKTTNRLRRNSVDALTRMGSSLKRNASKLRQSTAAVSSSRKGMHSSNSLGPLEPLTLAIDAETSLSMDSDGKHAEPEVDEATEENVGAIPSSQRQGVVESVRGPRRAVAAEKMGLSGATGEKGVAGKTMKVVG